MSKFKDLTSQVSRKYSVKLLQAKKNSPAIMFGAGVVGVVATVVLASRATLKLEAVLDETQENHDKAKHLWENGYEGKAFYEDDAEYKKDVMVATLKGGINIAKLYAPAVIVGSLAIGCLTGAHITLQRRNGALMLAYAGLEKAYREYENRVKKEVGDEKARELKFGIEEHEVYSEKKNGEPVVKVVKKAGGAERPYAAFFGPGNPNWNPTPEFNIVFLRAQQNYWNDQLSVKGYVMLNDVYDALGLERTSAGAVVGWVYGSDLPGDNYVDFGCWGDESMDKFHDFMVGREQNLLLDFNVAGTVYELIDRIAG
jgi:hypothetical protein